MSLLAWAVLSVRAGGTAFAVAEVIRHRGRPQAELSPLGTAKRGQTGRFLLEEPASLRHLVHRGKWGKWGKWGTA